MKTKISLLSLVFLFLLACNTVISFSQPQSNPTSQQSIGYSFLRQIPQSPGGDRSAAKHLFVHKYPFPSDGYAKGVVFLNDSDSGAESFILLILRPVSGGWKVIHRVDMGSDDQPPAKTGITTIYFGIPLDVKKGDVFAHYQSDDTGPIPLNEENLSVEGLSFGKYGFNVEDIEEGQIVPNQNFSGGRDYFINLIFEAKP